LPLEASVFSRRLLDEVGRVIRNCVAIYCVSLKVKALSVRPPRHLQTGANREIAQPLILGPLQAVTFAFSATGLSLFHRAVPRKPNYTSYV